MWRWPDERVPTQVTLVVRGMYWPYQRETAEPHWQANTLNLTHILELLQLWCRLFACLLQLLSDERVKLTNTYTS